MIGIFLDQLLDAAADAFAGFFMSAERDRARYAARHPDRSVAGFRASQPGCRSRPPGSVVGLGGGRRDQVAAHHRP